MRILFLSSEVAPWSKSGGLGDVAGALPFALAARGHEVRVMTPLYGSVPREGLSPEGGPVRLRFPVGEWEARYLSAAPREGCTVTFVEQPHFFGRAGLYGDKHHDYGDNALRFTFFTMAALTGAQAQGFFPDVVHLNDWQVGLGALALKTGYQGSRLGRAQSVFTIHNLAYQGNFPRHEVDVVGLPWDRFGVDGVEFYHQLSFMKAGLQFGDALTTVSPTYAREIQTKEGGVGLDGLLQQRAGVLHGILNGVDTREWNPATDVLLPARFSSVDLGGRALCRQALLERCHLSAPVAGMPVFGLVGRMVEQKGVDLVQAALPALLEQGASAVVLGSGARHFEETWQLLSRRFPRRLHVHVGFDNSLAHLIEAGSDFFLMPSRFEPCGLNQMYSLLYGAVPLVREVGGLADTVRDAASADGTGLTFREPTIEAFRGALYRAVSLYREPEHYARVRARGMAQDLSWARAAAQYETLYASLVGATPSGLRARPTGLR